ncbi:MAG: cytochrome c [Phycisphaerae bacterium]|nr:cytochrome c [Phycisphaerae bacterium]
MDSSTTRAVARRALIPIVGFGVYAGAVALVPVSDPRPIAPARADTLGARGIEAWRAAGCQHCHSIYGLGGHTGPDLTTIISRTSGAYVRAMVRNGLPGMPAYRDLDERSLARLIRYLEAVDRSGAYPPKSLRADPLGGS